MRYFVISLLVALFAMPAPSPALAQARVIDGDTIEWNGQNIDLYGIDAPESRQTCRRYKQLWHCGREATKYLQRLIRGRAVSCKPVGATRKKRQAAKVKGWKCFTGRRDLGGIMVSNGYALADLKQSKDYLPQQGGAKVRKIGLWGSRFIEPRLWRRGKRLAP